jgi:hypothetical protein
MKYNLLRMVQLILSSMDSDEVNTINDTVESRQVVDVIETTYNDLMSELDLPEHYDFFELQPSNDITKPTWLRIPEGVISIDYIQYDNAEDLVTVRNFQNVNPLVRYDFFQRMNSLDSADANVYQYNYLVGTQTFDVRGYNDRFPGHYTVVADHSIIFDNYRADLEQTIVANKTMCYGKLIPVFQRQDTFVPDLDPENFTLLFNEAKSQAFIELKQVANAKADQRARRALVSVSRNKHKTEQPMPLRQAYDFGRKGPGLVSRFGRG